MKILYLVCLLPLLTVWTSAHKDQSDDGKETSRWERRDGMPERHGGHKTGYVRVVGMVEEPRKGRHHNDKDDMSMSHREEDSSEKERGRQSERKDWIDRRRDDDKTWEGNDEDRRRPHGDYSISSEEDRSSYGKKPREGNDDDNDDGDRRRGNMKEGESRRGSGRRPHGRKSMDDGESGRNNRRYPMGDEDRRRPRGDDSMGAREDRSPYGRKPRDDDDRQRPNRRNHMDDKDRRRPRGGDSMENSEEDLRRAYIKFFGKIDMMKESKGSGSWEREGDDNDSKRQVKRRQGGKKHNRGDKNKSNDEDKTDEETYNTDDMDTESIKMKLKSNMKQLYKANQYELAGVVTISFLKMCECDGDDATKLLQKFIAKAEKTHEDDRDVKKMPEIPEVPNFKGNETAKVEFYRRLSMEQKELLFGYDLIQNMCRGAKVFLTESKTFFDKYFPRNNSGIPLDARVIKP